jgi:hypothetical protein
MNEQEQRRPWWRKKRWIAVAVLGLAIGYPTSLGPALYCMSRGVLPEPLYNVYATPVGFLIQRQPRLEQLSIPYLGWWRTLAREHGTATAPLSPMTQAPQSL